MGQRIELRLTTRGRRLAVFRHNLLDHIGARSSFTVRANRPEWPRCYHPMSQIWSLGKREKFNVRTFCFRSSDVLSVGCTAERKSDIGRVHCRSWRVRIRTCGHARGGTAERFGQSIQCSGRVSLKGWISITRPSRRRSSLRPRTRLLGRCAASVERNFAGSAQIPSTARICLN